MNGVKADWEKHEMDTWEGKEGLGFLLLASTLIQHDCVGMEQESCMLWSLFFVVVQFDW